jgi:hypothetical protein
VSLPVFAGTVTLTWTQAALPPDWQASTSYAPGQTICPQTGNAGAYIFFAQSGGGSMVSGLSAPTWTQTPYDQTAPDGGIADWENNGITCPPVLSNNVYRSSTSGGPYSEIYSSSSPITTYANTSVSPGTYYYVITAVNSNGESLYSGEVTAIVPGSSTPVPRSGRGSAF